MATVNVSGFDGTEAVSAYTQSQVTDSGVVQGSAVETDAAAVAGVASFTTLTEGVAYVAIGGTSGRKIYFQVDEPTTELASDDNVEITGDWEFSGGLVVDDVEIDGDINHDGSTVGFYGATPVAQASALTAADGSTVDTTYGQEEADVIANLVTRVGELETALTSLGLIAAAE